MSRLILIIVMLAVVACSNSKSDPEAPLVQNETPATLDESKVVISKRYNSDIVDELFVEAANINPKLKDLAAQIENIAQLKIDSLQAYNKYAQTSDRYWASFDNYINQLNDSSIKNELKSIVRILKEKHESEIANHEKAIRVLNDRVKTLNDYEIVMKLIVATPMMDNYLRNELPDIKTINKLIGKYDTLIKDVKPYTVIHK